MMEMVSPLGADMSISNTMASLSSKATLGLQGNAKIDAAARDFEAMLATQLLKPMFDTVPVDDTFGGGHGEEIMRSFMLQEYGKQIAKTGMLGIASQVKTVMIRAQENAKARGGAGASEKTSSTKSDAPLMKTEKQKGTTHVTA